MYKSKLSISTKNKKNLSKKLDIFLKKNDKINCRILKRNIFLSKLPEIILNRKLSALYRLQTFFVAIDILKHEQKLTLRINNGLREYEVIGLDKNGKEVYIHFREEKNSKKDKKLFFLSCYQK